MAQPLDRAVVEVDLADPEAGRRGQRVADDLDLVVLGRDLDEPELEVADRVVGAVVPEAKARRLGARGPPDDLVPEADAEQRPAVVDDRPGERDLGVEPRRVAGPGRQDHAIDVGGEDVRGRCRVRQDPDARATSKHRPDDVVLEPEVDDRDAWAAGVLGRVVRHGRRRDLPDEILVLPAGHGPGGRHGRLTVDLTGRRDDPAQAAARAQVPGERTGVHARDRRDRGIAQERRQLPGIVEHRGRRVRHDQRPEPRPDRLVVVGQAPVVADQRVGHDHDLAGIRGVGADLLVAGLARIDDEVAAGRDRGPERHAREDRPILERQQRGTQVADPRVDDRTACEVPVARVGRSRGPGYDEPTGLGGSVGGRVRRHRCLLRRPHGTGTPASQDRP